MSRSSAPRRPASHLPQTRGWPALLLLLAVACVNPPASESGSRALAAPFDDGGDILEAGAEREPALRTDGRVAVRLGAVEGEAAVQVRGSTGGAQRIAASDLAPGEQVRLRPAPGGRLELEGRAFAGELVFERRAGGGLRAHELVMPEDYVRGVVAAELAIWSAPPALLEAQAIAARTYAAYTLRARGGSREGAFLWDSTLDQAYATADRTDALPRQVLERLDRAVERTAGLVLVHRGVLLESLYHAACGGWTASVVDVFGRRGPLVPVPCPPCTERAQRRDPDVVWSWTASPAQLSGLARRLGLGPRLNSLAPALVDEHDRWLQVRLVGPAGSATLPLNELRGELGARELKGSRIDRTWPVPGATLRGGLRFDGRGRGHGVGLCQTGARDLADAGASARQILAHYYSGATLLPLARVSGVDSVLQ